MTGTAAPLALLVRAWPKLSETFILEEVLGLERLGVDLRLYALAAPTDTIVHGAVARVRAPLVHVPTVRAASDLVGRHLEVLRSSPLAWFGALASAAVDGLRGGRAAWRGFLRAGWLAAQWKRDGVGHVHVHFISDTVDVAHTAARMAGLRFSISAHAKDIYLSDPRELRRKLKAATFTVTCTGANRDVLASVAPAADVHLMYHGIDGAVFDPACVGPDKAPPHDDGCCAMPASRHAHVDTEAALPRLLAVGRLREKKGFDTLIDACRLLHEGGRPVRCDIVGYGEAHDDLARRIENAGLDRHVRLLGKLAREKVIECYANATVFVQPSRIAADGDRDGIPNVMLEAMAMTLPVVATRVSGIPEVVIDGVNGLLVEPDAPLALADAIERMLVNPRVAAAMGRSARLTVTEGFDNDRNLRLLIGLLARPPHERSSTQQAVDFDARLAKRASSSAVADEHAAPVPRAAP